MYGRRSLLKLIGAAPALAGSARTVLAETLASPAVLAGTALLNGGQSGVMPQQDFQGLGKTIWNSIASELKHAEDERWHRQQARQGGFDPDIAVMRSTSKTYKALTQRARDYDESSLLRHANRVLYGS